MLAARRHRPGLEGARRRRGPRLRGRGSRGNRRPRRRRRCRRALGALRRSRTGHAREPRARQCPLPRDRPDGGSAACRRRGCELVPLGRLLRLLACAPARQDRDDDPARRRRDLPRVHSIRQPQDHDCRAANAGIRAAGRTGLARSRRRAEHRARRRPVAPGARLLDPRCDPARLLRAPGRRHVAMARDVHRHPPAAPARARAHRAILVGCRACRVRRRGTAGRDPPHHADGARNRRREAALQGDAPPSYSQACDAPILEDEGARPLQCPVAAAVIFAGSCL